jgi:hypothetical protein
MARNSLAKKAALGEAIQAARTKRRASAELQSPRKRPATQSSTRTLDEDGLSEVEGHSREVIAQLEHNPLCEPRMTLFLNYGVIHRLKRRLRC